MVARSVLLSSSSIWGHCFIATYQIIIDNHGVDAQIKKASKACGALRGHSFSTRDVSERLEEKIYSGGVLAVLLYGCESWCLTAESASRLRNWHNNITSAYAKCAGWRCVNRLSTKNLQRAYRSAWVSSRLSTTSQAALYSGLATSHACLRVCYPKGPCFREYTSRG